MKEIKKILQNYNELGSYFYYIVFVVLSFGTLLLLFPKLVEKIIGVIEQGGTYDELWFWGMVGCGLLLVTNVFRYLDDVVKADMRERLYFKRSQYIRKKIVEKDSKDILNEGTGKLVSRVSRGTNAEVEIFEAMLQIITVACFRTIIVLIIISLYYPSLLLLLIVSTCMLLCLNLFFLKEVNKLSDRENILFEQGDRVLVRMINENLVIKLFGKKDIELEKSYKILSKIPEIAGKRAGIYSLSYVAIFTCIKGLELVMYLYIGKRVLEGGSSIAELILLISYITIMWHPLEKAASEINRITKNMQAYKRLQNFIEIANDIVNGIEKYSYKNGSIEFKNINFSYSPERQIFQNFTLKLLSGKKNALIGHSGGGKSTITKLILRLYDIQSGEILLDNQEIKTLNIQTFYEKIGYLPQEPAIFDGTIRENMEYAFSECATSLPLGEAEGGLTTEDKEALIWEALKKAQINDLVEKLELGLDTEVGEKGIKLSGGEKQRLAIARIFLKNPEIIILDEPTSALDSISEAKITQSLEELTKGKTSIVIAHRLQTVMNADKIIVIEDGKVEAEGKHEKLLEDSEVYRNLVDLQNGKMIE